MSTRKLNKESKRMYAFCVNTPKERGLTRRTTRKADAIQMYTWPTYDVDAQLTDTATAYVLHRSQWCVYHVLNTIYSRCAVGIVDDADAYSGSMVHKYGMGGGSVSKLYQLICQWHERYADDTDEMTESIQRDEHDYKTQKIVHHTKKLDKALRRFVPIMPYDTLEFTDAGRALLASVQIRNDLDVDDLVSVAYVAALEMVRSGVIVDWHDLSANQRYMARAVARAIYSERRANGTESIEYLVQFDSNGNESTVYGDRAINRILNGIQIPQQMLIDAIGEIIAADSKKSFDVESAKIALSLYADGYTLRDVADAMGKDFKQVKRWISKARQIAYNHPVEIAELLS